MDTIFNQIHIIGQGKIVLININQRLQDRYNLWRHICESEKLNPPSHDSKLTRKGQAWEEHNSAPKGQRDANSSIVLATMDYSFVALSYLSYLSPPSMYQGVPYIASQGIMKGRIRAISRHIKGQESNESDPCQGKLQKDLDYAHIPMYTVIWVKPVYVRAYRLYHFSCVFRDDQGNIKG